MFNPHLADISVARQEPGSDFDAKKAHREVLRQFALIAERAVTKDLLQAPKTKEQKKRAAKRIDDQIENEARRGAVAGFLDEWNRWRKFYFDLDPMEPKSKGQLTRIESAIQFCNEHKYHLPMLIACVMKSYEGGPFRPNFDAIVKRGEELYERNYDAVMADVDRAEYEETSSHRNK
jgi:hypothetical protein